MTVLGILSAKGGVGASLVATNLGCFLATTEKAMLVDLNPGLGADDLLLDLTTQLTWADLLPVAKELEPKHLQQIIVRHASGLNFLPAPDWWLDEIDWPAIGLLLGYLSEGVDWLLLDMPTGKPSDASVVFSMMDIVLIVTTADPPALRGAGRLIDSLPAGLRRHCGLVVNQITRFHPVSPTRIARSLEIPLLAALEPDSRAVGYQVSFGDPCVCDGKSHFGSGIVLLGATIKQTFKEFR